MQMHQKGRPMRLLGILGLLSLAACGDLPGPSVPAQPGQNLQSARQAVYACSANAARGGQNAVVSSYVGGVLFGGVLVGPIIVASNEGNIRAHGEAGAVDRCLNTRGFKRRDLTPAEVQALNRLSGSRRHQLLDHLISGQSLETFNASAGYA